MNSNLKYLVLGGGAIALAVFMIRKSKKEEPMLTTTDSKYPNPAYSVRGYRNNNPLNIVYSAKNDWLGQIVPTTDSRFCQFVDMKYGYRAAFRNIRSYINNYGANTIRKIIEKWAPPVENNTSNYANMVTTYSGVPLDAVLTEKDTRLKKVVAAMSMVENGTNVAVPQSSLDQGWNLYLQSI